MTIEHIETLIIGGGQAGLTMSHRLSQRGRPHLVVERHRIAERWRTERWDGLRFQFPNWSVQLPDFPFRHDDPDGFTTSAAIVDFITAYAAHIAAPVRCGVEVTALRDGDAGFVAETSQGSIAANHVVIATGPYQRAVVPDLPIDGTTFQIHASRYRGPAQLPKAPFWSWAPARRARRSPRNCCARAAASISVSASIAACPGAIAATISSAGSS